MFTHPIPECRGLFDTEHALKVAFCQALKHSGRLIKSIPQAAAPSGTHTEKILTESLIHNQKNEGML